MSDRVRTILVKSRNNGLIVLGILVAVAVSFVFTGNLGFQAYSDRLLWVGMIISILGGPAALADNAKEKAQHAYTQDQQNHEEQESPPDVPETEPDDPEPMPAKRSYRYTSIFRFWVIGIICIALSALVSLMGG